MVSTAVAAMTKPATQQYVIERLRELADYTAIMCEGALMGDNQLIVTHYEMYLEKLNQLEREAGEDD